MTVHRNSDELLDELENVMKTDPDRLVISEYTLKDSKSGVEFWIANGKLCTGVYSPTEVVFSKGEKARFWTLYTAFCRRQIASMLRDGGK